MITLPALLGRDHQLREWNTQHVHLRFRHLRIIQRYNKSSSQQNQFNARRTYEYSYVVNNFRKCLRSGGRETCCYAGSIGTYSFNLASTFIMIHATATRESFIYNITTGYFEQLRFVQFVISAVLSQHIHAPRYRFMMILYRSNLTSSCSVNQGTLTLRINLPHLENINWPQNTCLIRKVLSLRPIPPFLYIYLAWWIIIRILV